MMVSTFILFQYYGVCTDLSPNTLLTQNMDFHAHQSPGIITMCMYACTRMQVCVFALCICCIRGDAVLCLPQWSIWKAVREMNDCRYID